MTERKIKAGQCKGCGTEIHFVSNPKIWCKPCGKVVRNKRKSDKYKSDKSFNKYVKQKAKNYVDNNLPLGLFQGMKFRARTRFPEFIFDVKPEDVTIPDVCPVFGTPFIRNTKFAASVDRIDNTKGYIRGNIQVISRLANSMKNNATQEQLEKFAHWILNKKGKEMNEAQVLDYVTEELEERTLEEILEDHDLTPQEVFVMLFNYGHISEETLEEQMRVYNLAD